MWKLLSPVAVVLLLTLAAANAQAAPIIAGTTLINEDEGFEGVCDAPCFVATLDYEVWAPGDPMNPLALAGNNTFLYQVSNLTPTATLPPPGIPLTELALEANFSFVTGAGSIAGPGIAPTSTSIAGTDSVSWSFPLADQCPNCLVQGEMSEWLFIHSPLLPDDSLGSLTAIVLDTSFTTVGPTGAIPEPTAAATFVAGLALFAGAARRRS